MAEIQILRFRRGTQEMWFTKNPTLREGEPGYEIGTGKHKIGDGKTPWNELSYVGGGGALTQEDLDNHVSSETPHPAYDDGTSFVLRYQNAKV